MIIIRYAEISLKGKNRAFFENILVKNIKLAFPDYKITKPRNRILLHTDKKLNLSGIFGIASYSYADELDLDIEEIKKKSLSLAKKGKSFRITCQRLDKSLPFKSTDIEKKVGEYVFENTKSKVNLKNPDINIQIELFNNKAYVFAEKMNGAGGLPVGVEGKAIASIENQDSVKAALSVMKRGCGIIPDAFKKKDIQILNKKTTTIKDFKELEDMAEKHKAKALVTEQKIKNFKQLPTKLMVLRPLIAE